MVKALISWSIICMLTGCNSIADVQAENVTSEYGVDGGESNLIAKVMELTDEYAIVQLEEEKEEYGEYRIPKELEDYDCIQFYFEHMGNERAENIKVGDIVSLTYSGAVKEGNPPEIFAIRWSLWSPKAPE